MKIYTGEQQTEEWHKLRLGKFTSFDFHIFFGNSTTKEKELFAKAAERITSRRSDSKNFSNKHIDRGNELQEDAILMYELQKNVKVESVAFVELNKNVGCSPDGLIGTDGIIEVKCPDDPIFLKSCVKGIKGVIPTYKTQVQFAMYVTNRSWCDFIYYNPNFKDPIHVIRIDRDDDKIEEIKEQLIKCEEDIKNILDQYRREKC